MIVSYFVLMGNSDIPKPEELRAFRIVAKHTGAIVEHRDGRFAPPRTPDAELLYRDGRRGWLEVSTLGTKSELELRSFVPRAGVQVPSPGIWDWRVLVTNRSAFQRARIIADQVILTCEDAQVAHPGELPAQAINDANIEWAAFNPDAIFMGIVLPTGSKSNSPVIHFMSDDVLASSRFGPQSLKSRLDAALGEPLLQSRIDKLRRAMGEERHLYLRVTKDGIGERNMFVLVLDAFTGEGSEEPRVSSLLSEGDPDLPPGITDLWLDTEWGSEVTRWTRGVGWSTPRSGAV